MAPDDVLALFAIFGFVFAAAYDAPDGGAQARGSRRTLPPWVFEVVWAALYVCVALSASLFWMTRLATTTYFVAFLLLAISVLLNRAWVVVYFRYNYYYAAFAVLAGILATGVGYLVCVALHEPGAYEIAAMILVLPYLAWLVAAFFLLHYAGPQVRKTGWGG